MGWELFWDNGQRRYRPRENYDNLRTYVPVKFHVHNFKMAELLLCEIKEIMVLLLFHFSYDGPEVLREALSMEV